MRPSCKNGLSAAWIAISGLALAVSAPRAQAAFTLTIAPDGAGNVVEIGSGTINTTALDITRGGASQQGSVEGGVGEAVAGPATDTTSDFNVSASGPSSFGGFANALANSGSGDLVGIDSGSLFTPNNYVSGTALSDRSVFNSTDLSTLGLTPGMYVYTWGNGATADSFTVDITNTPIPEPASLGVLAVGALSLLGRRRRVL